MKLIHRWNGEGELHWHYPSILTAEPLEHQPHENPLITKE